MDYTTLITSEHRDKPKFAALVGLLANAVGDIGAAIQSLPQAFDLDVAIGTQLDVVGLWVGRSRTVTDVLIVGFFGFSDDIVALPFGEEGNPRSAGGSTKKARPSAEPLCCPIPSTARSCARRLCAISTTARPTNSTRTAVHLQRTRVHPRPRDDEPASPL
jgi:hypothetical protein